MNIKLADVTPEMVKEAYENTGLKPIRKEWADKLPDGTRCGCALTAVACANGADFDVIEGKAVSITIIRDIFGCSTTDLIDFIAGFDDNPSQATPNAQLYIRGQECAKLIFKEVKPDDESI